MSAPARILDVLAEDWERQKDDAIQFEDPNLGDRTAGELAALASRLCADLDRDLGALQSEIRLRVRPFFADWPALVRWRDGVLRDPRRHPAHVVAAALEAIALECTLAGQDDLAHRARAQAEAIVLGRRREPQPPEAYAT